MEFIFMFVFLCLLVYGYAANIYKLIFSVTDIAPLKLVRVIGIFVPIVGIVVGFIN